MKTFVIIAAYNEEKNIVKVIKDTKKHGCKLVDLKIE